MNFTVAEKELIDLIHRLGDEYKALERNEGRGTDNDRSMFMQGLALASNVLEIRALRRDKT